MVGWLLRNGKRVENSGRSLSQRLPRKSCHDSRPRENRIRTCRMQCKNVTIYNDDSLQDILFFGYSYSWLQNALFHRVPVSHWSGYHNCWVTLLNSCLLHLSSWYYLSAVQYTALVADWWEYLAVNYSKWFISCALKWSAPSPIQQTCKYMPILLLPLSNILLN